MLTAEQIDRADPFLSETAIKQLLTQIRSLDRYQKNPRLFPNLETKLGSLKSGVVAPADEVLAKIANAALTAIEAVGPGQTALEGGSKGIKWSKRAKREEFIEDVLNALYESPAARASSAVVPMRSNVIICSLHHVNRSRCGCGPVVLAF